MDSSPAFFRRPAAHRDAWTQLALPKSLALFPEAERVLRRFGRLRFGRSDDFVDVDPRFGEEVAEEIKMLAQEVKRQLYPVGIMEHQDREYILVDEQGVVYVLSVGPTGDPKSGNSFAELRPLASSFESAVGFLIRYGVWRREKKDDLDAIEMLGKVWQVEKKGGSA